MKTRIAPTPSGFLHTGNAVSFLITYCLAKCENGKILLRIDDLDRERYRQEYVDDIFYSLDWLDIQYDLGPVSVASFEKEWSQSNRLYFYESFLNTCLKNDWVYACDCTRKELISSGIYPVYDGKCSKLNKSFTSKMAWRWKIEKDEEIQWHDLFRSNTTINLPKQMGDFVVKQKNGFPSYQVASFIDDQYFNITHIIRGEDLMTSTAAQLNLASRSDSTHFKKIIFGHHPLITDDNGLKLSKSAGAKSLKALREKGQIPFKIFEIVRKLLGLPDVKVERTKDLVELCMAFNPFSNEKIGPV